MLLIFPIILCSNFRGCHLLCFAFLPIMLESMIDINVKKKHLETMDLLIPTQFGRVGHFSRSSKKTLLEIVLSESDVGIALEVAELQATELELSSAMLSLLPLT